MIKDAYNKIGSIVESWCKKHAYQTMIVTISMKYEWEKQPCIFSEIMEFDCDTCSLVWRSDWWEGQQSVELIGFCPLSDIKIIGQPEP